MSDVNNQGTRSLKQLLRAWKEMVGGTAHAQPPPYEGPDVTLSQLTEDSRAILPQGCFVARVRTGSDGHTWIGQAIAAGAALILAQHPIADIDAHLPDNVIYWQVPDTAETMAWLAAAWHDFPSRDLVTVGVTGTNGKTTTVTILVEMMRAAGLQVGMISTLKAMIGDEEEATGLHVSTPEAPVIQAYLRRMVDAGMTHCVLESTSHGLAQHRVTAVDFDVSVITNITHEHLDYHGTFQAYTAAKKRLFEFLSAGRWNRTSRNLQKAQLSKTAVLNTDDESFAALKRIEISQRLTYGLREQADVCASELAYGVDRTRFTLHLPPVQADAPEAHRSLAISAHLVGEFNLYNMLAAATTAAALGIAPEAMATGLAVVTAISGRLQRIDQGQPFPVLVDFAHTPDALQKTIEVARHMTAGRVITVFGSAGGRDVEKRRLMAEISGRLADLSILTAEDPRHESLVDILDMMAAGCRSVGGVEGETFWRIADRGQAIYFALSLAQPADLVLVCGKGHEQSMCFGNTEYPWDDRLAAAAALTAFLGDQPMSDLGLPTFSDNEG